MTVINAIVNHSQPRQPAQQDVSGQSSPDRQPKELQTASTNTINNDDNGASETQNSTQQRFRIAAAPPRPTSSNRRPNKRSESVIYVGGLLHNTTEAEITSHLNEIDGLQASDVVDVKLLRRRGFASFKVTLSSRCNMTQILSGTS